MWLLLFIVLQQLPSGAYPATVLEQYKTYDECNHEADRVFGEMQKAYPGDKSYTIQCVKDRGVSV